MKISINSTFFDLLEAQQSGGELFPRKTRIFVVRHGESESNAEGKKPGGNPKIGGQTDNSRLTHLGQQQALAAGKKISKMLGGEPIHHIISSPLQRAYSTAEGVANGAAYSGAIETHPGLAERYFGEYEGAHPNVLSTNANPEYMIPHPTKKGRQIINPDWKPKGGESLRDVQARTVPVIKRIAKNHRGENIVITTHGHTMRAITSHFLGWDQLKYKRPENGEVRVFEI